MSKEIMNVEIESFGAENVVSSRVISKQLNKNHSHVLRDIDKILENPNMVSLIKSSTYEVFGQIRKYKQYLLTKGKGYTKSITWEKNGKSGIYTKFTQKVRVEIHNLLEKVGVYATEDMEV